MFAAHAAFAVRALRAPVSCTGQARGAAAVSLDVAPSTDGLNAPSTLRGAQARLVPWAMGRAVAILGRSGRRPLRLGEGAGFTPDERAVVNILDLLGRGDRDAAQAAAQWLVRSDARDGLLRALEPAAAALR